MLSQKLAHIVSTLADSARHGPLEPAVVVSVAAHLHALLEQAQQLEQQVIPRVSVTGPIHCAEVAALARLYLADRCTLNEGQTRLLAAAALVHIHHEQHRVCPSCAARERGV